MKAVLPQGVHKVQSRYANVFAHGRDGWKLVAAQITEVDKHLRDFSSVDAEDQIP